MIESSLSAIAAETLPSAAALSDETVTKREPLDERALIAVTCVGHALCHIGELVFAGVMMALMREFQLDPQQVTALALLGYILMGAGALPVGVWADAWGPLRLLKLYFVAMALAALAVALASGTVELFVALTALGLATSIYHPVGMALLSLGVKERGRAMGINGVAGSVGIALGPFLGLLAADLGTWRLAYVVVAALAVAGGVHLWIVSRDGALDLGRIKADRHLAAVPIEVTAVTRDGESTGRWRTYLPLVLLMGVMMLGGFNYRCLVTAMPPFLCGEGVLPIGSVAGAVFLLLVMAVGGVGQYCGGWLADRFGASRIYLRVIGGLVPLSLGLGFLGGSPVAVLVAAALAACLFAQQPVENALLADFTSTGRRSTSYGTKFALTFGVGAAGAHVTGMVWKQLHSVAPVFFLIAGSATVMVVLVLILLRQARPAAPR